MKRGLVVLSVVSLALAGVASASVQQGDVELDFLGGLLSENGDGGAEDFDAIFLSAGLGYFLTENFQGQVAALGAWIESGDTDTDVYGIGVRGKYHFMPTNQWVPYVGGQLMWVNYDSDDDSDSSDPNSASSSSDGDSDGVLWGPLVGLRFELNENNDFFVEYQYHMWDGDVRHQLDDGHCLFVGLVHQFK